MKELTYAEISDYNKEQLIILALSSHGCYKILSDSVHRIIGIDQLPARSGSELYVQGLVRELEEYVADNLFSRNELQALRLLFQQAGEKAGVGENEDAVTALIAIPGITEALGVEAKTEDGAFRMIRHDKEIHDFLGKIYRDVIPDEQIAG